MHLSVQNMYDQVKESIGLTFYAQVTWTYKLGPLAFRLHIPILIWEMNSQYRGLIMMSKKEGYMMLTKGSCV